MPARKHYKVDIDVVPYLSIMAIVLKLISLILIVMVMRIASNPEALKVIRYKQLFSPPEEAGLVIDGVRQKQISRVPVYFDCRPEGVEIIRFDVISNSLNLIQNTTPVHELRDPKSDVQFMLDRLQTNSAAEYAILIVRPKSTALYRYIRREVNARRMPVGYDALGSEVVIDWQGSVSNLNVRLDDLLERQRKEETVKAHLREQEEARKKKGGGAEPPPH